VTVVLDSCHSGGATRGDDVAIRGNDAIDPDLPKIKSLVAGDDELIKNWQALTEGSDTGSTLGRWLPRSRDYVLLAACRPNEYAYEYTVSGKQRHGALTYWMIDTLTSSLSGLTYKALHDRISAKIQSKFSNQMPMLMGEIDRVVFGSDRIPLQYAVNVLEVDPEPDEADQEPLEAVKVRLSTGMAGGIGLGARFAIYPPGTTDFTKKERQLAIAEIAEVTASDAWADVVEVFNQSKVEQGCQAVMIGAPVDLVRGVRLFKKAVGDRDHELPQSVADKQDMALQAVEDALADNGWLKLAGDQQKEDYLVAVNRKGEYEICKGLPIENLRPALTVDAADAATKVVQRLVHLAKYQAVEEIDNPDSEIAGLIEFELLNQNKQPFPDLGTLELKQGQVVYLRIKNKSAVEVFNIAALDLEPTWEISQIPVLQQDELFYALQPHEEKLIRLRFAIPDNKAYDRAPEVLKLFGARGAANFQWLTLPSLDEAPQKRAGVRSLGNPFAKLLETIGRDGNMPAPTATRGFFRDPDPAQEWLTKEIRMVVMR
jgi:Caspase domain